MPCSESRYHLDGRSHSVRLIPSLVIPCKTLSNDLQERLGKTIVFVTHDMDEAIKLASRIAIMSEGRVIQFDTPENILRHPAKRFRRRVDWRRSPTTKPSQMRQESEKLC